MKQLIKKILREQEEEIIQAPPFAFFDYGWQDVLDWADDRLFRMNGNIDLSHSNITTLGGLVEVGGNLDLWECENLQSLGELRSVNGVLDLRKTKIKSLDELRVVNGHLFLSESNIETLNKLEIVNGLLALDYCTNLKSFGNLKEIDGMLWLNGTPIVQIMTYSEVKKQIKNITDIVGY